jgi:hypothetical protein
MTKYLWYIIIGASLMACSARFTPTFQIKAHPIFGEPNTDSALVQILQPYQDTLHQEFDAIIASTKEALYVSRPTSNLMNWCADAVWSSQTANKRMSEPVICLLNTGGLRSSFGAGNLSLADFYKLMPFDNRLVWVHLPVAKIADIEYLQSNLFTALRVPKPFLGFEEATGEGKNLALQDIRFSRTINRIQQSMLQELNKIAIIHLFILGFEDDLDNFTLTLNNPSTQAEMLKIEHMQTKVTLVKDSTSDIGNGFAVMSWTRAHRDILGWSDDEIKQDLLEQRMEKAAAAELQNTSAVIKHTGMFDAVDKIYGDYQAALKGAAGGEEAGGEAAGGGGSFGGGGGGFGGGGLGGEDLDFGAEAGAEGGDDRPGVTGPTRQLS